jgi:hypothetical protein
MWYGGAVRWYSDIAPETRSHARRVAGGCYVLDGTAFARLFDRAVPP